jgi:hypothetical protein
MPELVFRSAFISHLQRIKGYRVASGRAEPGSLLSSLEDRDRQHDGAWGGDGDRVRKMARPAFLGNRSWRKGRCTRSSSFPSGTNVTRVPVSVSVRLGLTLRKCADDRQRPLEETGLVGELGAFGLAQRLL